MNENELSKKIIGAALKVHSNFGPGLLESVYESALAYELASEGIDVKRQLPMDTFYKGIKLEGAFCVDLLVGDKG